MTRRKKLRQRMADKLTQAVIKIATPDNVTIPPEPIDPPLEEGPGPDDIEFEGEEEVDPTFSLDGRFRVSDGIVEVVPPGEHGVALEHAFDLADRDRLADLAMRNDDKGMMARWMLRMEDRMDGIAELGDLAPIYQRLLYLESLKGNRRA